MIDINIFVKNVKKELHTIHNKSVPRHRRTCMIQCKDFKCEKCTRVFNPLDSLNRHTKVCKSGLVKKEIKCEICFKTFKSNWILKRHLKSCKAEKCFECPLVTKNSPLYVVYNNKKKQIVTWLRMILLLQR